MNLTQLSIMSYEEILEYVISAYIREFGERKFKTVLNKIMPRFRFIVDVR